MQTNSELMLENLIIDSIRERGSHKKPVFHLDLRIAPYKACILVQAAAVEKQQVANDLLKIFFKHNINVFQRNYKTDNDLTSLFDSCDELGVPFVIILPENLNKDGICYVRNRDTTIKEHLHFTKLIEHFKFLLESFDEI